MGKKKLKTKIAVPLDTNFIYLSLRFSLYKNHVCFRKKQLLKTHSDLVTNKLQDVNWEVIFLLQSVTSFHKDMTYKVLSQETMSVRCITLAMAFRRCLTSPSCRLWPVSTVFTLSTKLWMVSQTVSICCSFSVWTALWVDISWVNCLCADRSHSELPMGCSRVVS